MRETKRVLLEATFLLLCGALVALTANFFSPRGLSLPRDYFPGSAAPSATVTNTVTSTTERLHAKGLQVADSNLVVQLFGDPRRAQELIVFVDARNAQHYQEGHIPGAWLFDHYHAEDFFPTVRPVCQTALQIVVYCTGGTCEDSEFAAATLRDTGVPKEKLFVYPGGITEWQAVGMPVETGARNSGALREPKK